MAYKYWVLDVTWEPALSFCPLDADGSVLTGLSIITDRAPGILAGVISLNGLDHVETWLNENPGWRADFCNTSELTGEV